MNNCVGYKNLYIKNSLNKLFNSNLKYFYIEIAFIRQPNSYKNIIKAKLFFAQCFICTENEHRLDFSHTAYKTECDVDFYVGVSNVSLGVLVVRISYFPTRPRDPKVGRFTLSLVKFSSESICYKRSPMFDLSIFVKVHKYFLD